MKRGGEVVFFGDLGPESQNLITYFERYSGTAPIKPGENPATWMLTAIGAGSSSGAGIPFDYAGSYVGSNLHRSCLEKIEEICAKSNTENRVSFPSIYATDKFTQSNQVLERLLKIYWRSPSYNLVRVS